jgi:hypothetical protein
MSHQRARRVDAEGVTVNGNVRDIIVTNLEPENDVEYYVTPSDNVTA